MSAAFDVPSHSVQEHTIQHEKFAPMIKAWLNGTGPPQLFVYYQPPQRMNDAGEIVNTSDHYQMFVTDGEGLKLTGKGAYFLRCLPPGQPINDKAQYDAEVLFGEVHPNSVQTLNTLINNVYKPLVDKLPTEDWGVCEVEQKRDFSIVFEKFAKEL